MDRGTKRAAVGRRAVLMLPLAAWGGAVLLGGCGSGDPTYYTLQAWPGAPRRTAPTVVKVRMPTVAAFLDRDYIVSATDDYRLELAGNRAWAEPIAQMIGRVLSLDLAERLPDATVFSEDSAATRQADVVVSLDIGRFDADPGGAVIVRGALSLRPTDAQGTASAPTLFARFDLRHDRPGSDTAALVASLSELLGAVADQAADRLASLPPPVPETPAG